MHSSAFVFFFEQFSRFVSKENSWICGGEAVRDPTFQPVKMANGGLSQCFSSTLADSFDSTFCLTDLSTLVDSVVAVTKHPCIPISKYSPSFGPRFILWLLQNLRPRVRSSPLGHRPNVSSVLLVCPGVFLRFITSLKHRTLLERSSIGSGKLSSRKVWTRCSSFSWIL